MNDPRETILLVLQERQQLSPQVPYISDDAPGFLRERGEGPASVRVRTAREQGGVDAFVTEFFAGIDRVPACP